MEKQDNGDVEIQLQGLDDEQNLNELTKMVANNQPKMQKIKDFKARVLGLLEIYASQTKNHSQLFKALEGVSLTLIMSDVIKLDKVINISLSRKAAGVPKQILDEVIRQYSGLLCKVGTSVDSLAITKTFCKLIQLQLASGGTQQQAKAVMADLLQKYVTKRTVKVHLNTFYIASKTFPFLKQYLHEKVEEYLQKDLRPSMKKQLLQLNKSLGFKTQIVMKQQAVEQEQVEQEQVE